MELDVETNNEENISVTSTNHNSDNHFPISTPISDRKVHWNCKYVQILLDCVENRLSEFKNKSIHKKVWDDIGSQMKPYGFTTEHCYNKWKNLRRDVRMFAINPHKVTKNLETLNRVRKLISTICPNFDPTAVYKKSIKSPKNSPNNKHSEESSSSLEPLAKLLTPPTSPYSDINSADKELVSSPLELRTSLMNNNTNNQEHDDYDSEHVILSHHNHQHNQHNPLKDELVVTNFHCNNRKTVSNTNLWLPRQPNTNNSDKLCLRQSTTNSSNNNSNNNNNHNTTTNNSNNNNDKNSYASWPYELHELLMSFRSEELKQVHSIDQLVSQINEIRDSSVRRINTIEQLMNLANLLINSKLA